MCYMVYSAKLCIFKDHHFGLKTFVGLEICANAKAVKGIFGDCGNTSVVVDTEREVRKCPDCRAWSGFGMHEDEG